MFTPMPAKARSAAARAGAFKSLPPKPAVSVSTAPMMPPLVADLPRIVSPFSVRYFSTAAVSCGLMPAFCNAAWVMPPPSTSVLPADAPTQPPTAAPATLPTMGAAEPAAPPASAPPTMPVTGAAMLGTCSTMPSPNARRLRPVARSPLMTPGASRQSLANSPATSLMPPEIPSPRSQAAPSSLPSCMPGFARA